MSASGYEELVTAVERFEHTIATLYKRMRDQHADNEQLHNALAIMAKESSRHWETVGTQIRDRIPEDPFSGCERLRHRLQLDAVRRVGSASDVGALLKAGAEVEGLAADVYTDISAMLKAQVERYHLMSQFFEDMAKEEQRHRGIFEELSKGHAAKAATQAPAAPAPEGSDATAPAANPEAEDTEDI